jgi:hypothetical protein
MASKKPAAKSASKKSAQAAAPKAAQKKVGRPNNDTKLEALTPDFVTKTPEDLAAREVAARRLESEQDTHLAKIDATFGDNLPYDALRIENEVRFFLNESASSMLEAGSRLVLLKEHEDHGNFHKSLERIGLAPRAAQKLMQAALKFAGPKAQLATRLDKTKLLELVSEDDDELAELADGGSLKGLTLDEIDAMPASELRKALRASKAKATEGADISERLLASKDDKINKLERELRERQHRVATWEGAYKEIGGNILSMTGYAIQGIGGLRVQIDEVLKEANRRPEVTDAEISAIALPLHQQLQSLSELVTDVCAHFDFNLSGYLPQLNGLVLLQRKADLEAEQAG